MNANNEFLWYRLFQTEGFGPRARYMIWQAIRDSDLTLVRLFDMDRPEFEGTFPDLGSGRLARASFETLQAVDEEAFYQEYESLKDNDIEIVYPGHELYPERALELIQHALFPILFCNGQLSLLKSEGVAIVGSREASDEGVRIARQFAGDLALAGKNVVSGYARGIDTSAHFGALEKEGTTTIVLSLGILRFSRKRVFHNSSWEGSTLIVSQSSPTETWSSGSAMSRNKLVCALSKAIIVVESGPEQDKNGKRSGTFDAGRTALEMKIPLFVVSPRSLKNRPPGNTQLIRRGGIEIEPKHGIRTVLEHLAQKSEAQQTIATEEQISLF